FGRFGRCLGSGSELADRTRRSAYGTAALSGKRVQPPASRHCRYSSRTRARADIASARKYLAWVVGVAFGGNNGAIGAHRSCCAVPHATARRKVARILSPVDEFQRFRFVSLVVTRWQNARIYPGWRICGLLFVRSDLRPNPPERRTGRAHSRRIPKRTAGIFS